MRPDKFSPRGFFYLLIYRSSSVFLYCRALEVEKEEVKGLEAQLAAVRSAHASAIL
jgi:hypothetical protein